MRIDEIMKDIIKNDIQKCEEILKKSSVNHEDFIILYSKYIGIIKNWSIGLDFKYATGSYKTHIKVIKEKLEITLAYDMILSLRDYETVSGNINIINSNESLMSNNQSINIDINEIINNLEKNNLPNDVEQDVKKNIEEIKKLLENNTDKKTTFSKVLNILKYISDKSIDVAIQLLPIIVQNI